MNKFRRIFTPLILSTITYQYACQQPSQKYKNPQPASLQFKTRKNHLKDITDNPNYDVIVIGGGCNGVGVLLDASTRGLRSLIIEKDDFAAGASSKSTKLIHGGVRYLQQVFQLSTASISSRIEKFNLVKQSIIERSLMLDSAPYLTTKIPFVIPCTNIFQAAYYFLGSYIYYLIYHYYAPKSCTNFNMPYFINREQLTTIFPNISSKFNTGVVYEDGSFNDSRLLIAALLTATCGNGIKMPQSFVPANALNKTQFLDFIKEEGKIIGVVVRDSITKKQYKINAKYVVNCTGTWADKIRLKDNQNAKKRICAVGGSHITYDNRVASKTYGLCAPSSDGRIILVVPWLDRVIAGTTERVFNQPTNNPKCSPEQRNFINTTVYDLMSNLQVGKFVSYEKTRWCGLRPLVVDDVTSQTKQISRSHVVEVSSSGLYSLMGGKWTTYRKMGEDVVDKICEQQKAKGKQHVACQTAGLPLLGSCQDNRTKLYKQKQDIGVQLYNNFGSFATQIAKGNLQRVYGSTTRAQLQWIVNNELVTDIEDVLLRRTRLCFLISKVNLQSLATVVGEIMQKKQGWTDKQRNRIVKQSVERILSYEFQ